MKGIEYEVLEMNVEQPQFFVIVKQNRINRDSGIIRIRPFINK